MSVQQLLTSPPVPIVTAENHREPFKVSSRLDESKDGATKLDHEKKRNLMQELFGGANSKGPNDEAGYFSDT